MVHHKFLAIALAALLLLSTSLPNVAAQASIEITVYSPTKGVKDTYTQGEGLHIDYVISPVDAEETIHWSIFSENSNIPVLDRRLAASPIGYGTLTWAVPADAEPGQWRVVAEYKDARDEATFTVVGEVEPPPPPDYFVTVDREVITAPGYVFVTVTDPSLNKNPEVTEWNVKPIRARIFSSTDPRGATLELKEEGANSSIFTTRVEVSTFKESTINVLRVSLGDLIVVSYMGSDGNGPEVTATAFIAETLAPKPVAQIAIISPSPYSVNEPVSFSAADSYVDNSEIVRYHWDFGDGSTADGVTATHVYRTTGSYTVTLTVTEHFGQIGTASVLVEVHPQIELRLYNTSYGPGEKVEADVTITGSKSGDFAVAKLLDPKGRQFDVTDFKIIGERHESIVSLNLPLDASEGSWLVVVEYADIQGSTSFRVQKAAEEEPIPLPPVIKPPTVKPLLSLDKDEYNPGDKVLLKGKFAPSSKLIILVLDPADTTYLVEELQAGSDGRVSFSFELEKGAKAGRWSIEVSTGESIEELNFVVVEIIKPELPPVEELPKIEGTAVVKHRKKTTLVSIKNTGEVGIEKLAINVNQGDLRFVKVLGKSFKDWDRSRISNEMVSVGSDKGELRPGDHMLVMLVWDKRPEIKGSMTVDIKKYDPRMVGAGEGGGGDDESQFFPIFFYIVPVDVVLVAPPKPVELELLTFDLFVSSQGTDLVAVYDGITGEWRTNHAFGGSNRLWPTSLAFGPDVTGDGVQELYVGGSGVVKRYNVVTGEFIDDFASIEPGWRNIPDSMVFGPDVTGDGVQELYIVSRGSGNVRHYNGANGEFLGEFTSGGGLRFPTDLAFGPDGNLYVTNDDDPEASLGGPEREQVKRYDGTTGEFMGDFVVSEILNMNPTSLAFGPDGTLYVASNGVNEVRRYNGVTGEPMGNFLLPYTGQLDYPWDMVFGPDGNLYVTDFGHDSVNAYNATTGDLTGDFITWVVSANRGGLLGPTSLAFGPDGNLYIISAGNGLVKRYALSPYWRFMDNFAPDDALIEPRGLAFGPDVTGDGRGELYVIGNSTTEKVKRYDGYIIATLIDSIATGGGQFKPTDIVFGTDVTGDGVQELYLGNPEGKISIYDGISGTYLRDWADKNWSPLNPTIFTFGPDITGDGVGELYIVFLRGSPSLGSYGLGAYHGVTGTFIRNYSLDPDPDPADMAFGTDVTGDGVPELYFTNYATNEVRHINVVTGEYMGKFMSAGSGGLNKPTGLVFGPDGNLYVCGVGEDPDTRYVHSVGVVKRYNGLTGEFIGDVVPPGSSGINLVFPCDLVIRGG